MILERPRAACTRFLVNPPPGFRYLIRFRIASLCALDLPLRSVNLHVSVARSAKLVEAKETTRTPSPGSHVTYIQRRGEKKSTEQYNYGYSHSLKRIPPLYRTNCSECSTFRKGCTIASTLSPDSREERIHPRRAAGKAKGKNLREPVAIQQDIQYENACNLP